MRLAVILWLIIAGSCAYAAETNTQVVAPNTVSPPPAVPQHDSPVDPAQTSVNPHSLVEDTCLVWFNPTVPPRAIILCVHGLGLHNGTYKPLGKALAKSGFATYAIDVRGFGSWLEAQGHQQVDFDGCLADIKQVITDIRKLNPGLPVFLLGESMGGGIVIQAAAMYPQLIDGVIASVPGSDRFNEGGTKLSVALHVISASSKPMDVSKHVIGQATQKLSLREAWGEDPLDRMQLTAGELMQFDHFMKGNEESAKRITNTPVLFFQGSSDRLAKPEGSLKIFNAIPCADKQFLLVNNAEHLILEEGQFPGHVVSLLTGWIAGHLPPPGVRL